jgi:hypothetical protein
MRLLRRQALAVPLLLLPLALAGCVPTEPDPPVAPPIQEPDAPAVRDSTVGSAHWMIHIDQPRAELEPCWADDPSTDTTVDGEQAGVPYIEILLVPEAVSDDATRIVRCVAAIDSATQLGVFPPEDSAQTELQGHD